MANLKGWLNSGWEKISCTIIGNKVALDVVPRDADGGVLGGSDAPSHMVIVDENGPLLTGDNPGSVVLRGNDGSIVDLNYVPVKISGGTDPSVTFANGNAANTQKTITLTKPTGTIKKYHRLVFHNPSTETDLTVKIVNKGAIGNNTRWLLGNFIIPAKQTVTGTSIETDGRNIIADMFLGNVDVDLVISNNQVIGGAGAFTGTVQVYAL